MVLRLGGPLEVEAQARRVERVVASVVVAVAQEVVRLWAAAAAAVAGAAAFLATKRLGRPGAAVG